MCTVMAAPAMPATPIVIVPNVVISACASPAGTTPSAVPSISTGRKLNVIRADEVGCSTGMGLVAANEVASVMTGAYPKTHSKDSKSMYKI